MGGRCVCHVSRLFSKKKSLMICRDPGKVRMSRIVKGMQNKFIAVALIGSIGCLCSGAFFLFLIPPKLVMVGDNLNVKPGVSWLLPFLRCGFKLLARHCSVKRLHDRVLEQSVIGKDGFTGAKPFLHHRSGFVSRTCILAILASRGKELSAGTIELVIRSGGWQAGTRARTVLRVYARNSSLWSTCMTRPKEGPQTRRQSISIHRTRATKKMR